MGSCRPVYGDVRTESVEPDSHSSSLPFGDPSERMETQRGGPKALSAMAAQPPDPLQLLSKIAEGNYAMKNWKKHIKRGSALFIALVMCMSLLPAAALAVESVDDSAELTELKPENDQVAASQKACICNAAEGAPHEEDCPLYAAPEIPEEETAETKEEMPAKCTCEVRCAGDAETLCPVCGDDPAKCEGEEPVKETEEEPVITEKPAEPVQADSPEDVPSIAPVLAAVPAAQADEPEAYAIPGDAISVATGEELAEAYGKIQENESAAIYVTADLTMTEAIRCGGIRKYVTIIGQKNDGTAPVITRGEIGAVKDNARSTYNPAMFEVDGSLCLEKIILDDDCKTAGERYDQATTDGTGGNEDTVQDAIIAAYDDGDEIILGEGTELRNFGGMSAVRLSAGKLTMESGSAIVGSKEFDTKGGGTGAAGAVWIQGGELVMEDGAEIKGMSGRAIYVDGGSAAINGTIEDIKPNKYMWRADGKTGVVETGIHARNGAQVTLGEMVDNAADGANTGTAIALNGVDSSFTMVSGAVIKHAKDRTIDAHAASVVVDDGAIITDCENGIYIHDGAQLMLNGTITETKGGHPLQLNSPGGDSVTYAMIGKTGKIVNNYADYGAIYCQSGKIDLYGTIAGNFVKQHGGGIATPGHGKVDITMYPGAAITNNSCAEHGGGVQIKAHTTFTMKGGIISNNHSIASGGGVTVRSGGTFIMEGGEISGNHSKGYGGGVAVADGVAEFLGGEIFGNKMNAEIIRDSTALTSTATGGTDNDITITGGTGPAHYMVMDSGIKVSQNVYMSVNTKTVTVTDGTKLGNASSASVTALTKQGSADGFAAPIATLWVQNADSAYVTVAGVTPVEGKPIYVLAELGSGIIRIPAAISDGVISFNAPVSENGCALALVQPDNASGTLTLTADKTELQEGQTPYQVTYKLSFTPTSAEAAVTKVTAVMDSPLTGEGKDSVTLTRQSDGTWTGSWTGTLEQFEAGKSIITAAVATIEAGEADAKPVYSNGVETKLIPAPVVYYTITFNWANGGTVSHTVAAGSTVTAPAVPTYTSGNYRYTFASWNPAFEPNVTAGATYTAQYSSTYIGGTGGGGGGGGGRTTTIVDPEVPLAGDLQLNREDHFAYVRGYTDGTVRPNTPITRAQAATIFYRLLTDTSREIYFRETNDFTDVPDSHWANRAISTLSNAGVINGFQDGTFQPDAYITRAQFTAMTSRFEAVLPGLENTFADVSEDHWARDMIAYAANQGWVTRGGNFRPQENITRAEVMDMLNNVLDRRIDEEGLLPNVPVWSDVKAGDPYYYVVMEATISHDYERRNKEQNIENWTKLTEDPVWE